ncbi:PIN-like domain-containing protein [Nocardia rhamnosiphila]
MLDTNALLSMYRITTDARAEYLRALSLLGGRPWIPHRSPAERAVVLG